MRAHSHARYLTETLNTTSRAKQHLIFPSRAAIKAISAIVVSLSILTLSSAGCARKTPQVVKIGLVAPFEGRYREIGYDVIPAARVAIREWAARNEVGVAVEIVAYDDMGDPDLAIQQARKLVADPDVVIVLGHWRDETTQAALPIYEEAGLPLITFSTQDMSHSPGVYNLAPSEDEMLAAAQAWSAKESTPDMLWLGDSEDVLASAGQLAPQANSTVFTPMGGPVWGMNQFYALTGGMAENAYFVTGAAEPHDASGEYWTDERIKEFTVGFEQGSLGAPPGLFSISAYEATWLAIKQALATYGILIDGTPVDTGKFDERGRHVDAPIYLYVWRDGQRELVEQLR